MNTINVTYVNTESLSKYKTELRKHPKAKLKKLSKLIDEYGFIVPILIDNKTKEIVSGHARMDAAIMSGIEEIPIIAIDHLSSEQIRAFRIADNKITEGSEWNLEVLKTELIELRDLDFDLLMTGFEIPEIDMIILDNHEDSEYSKEDIPAPPKDPVVREGDAFQLGNHRITCSDCRNTTAITELFIGQKASLVITDPPYNVKINGHVLPKTEAHSEFAMASGEMTKLQFTEFLTEVFSVFKQSSCDGSLHYHFIDHKHTEEMLEAGSNVYEERLNICVWKKTNAGMGSLYRSQHEFCCVFKNGKASHTNNVQLGKYGRSRSNVWVYPGMNTFSENRDELLSAHPTVKNKQMIADIILDASCTGDLVFDGFLGSGTALLAAEQTGRICYASEIEPKYVEVAIARFQAISDAPVIHLETGMSFDELKRQRTTSDNEENNNE